MKEDASGRRQRAVMATDAEWERIGRAAAESGMDCCSARGLRADRRDKLLKWLDTWGQNCTPNNTLTAATRSGGRCLAYSANLTKGNKRDDDKPNKRGRGTKKTPVFRP